MTTAESGDTRPLARRIADVVLAVPGVVDLHSGLFGEVATYLPGGRVSGVSLDDDSGRVHLVVDIHHDLRSVAHEAAVAASEVAGFPISVTIEDIALATDTPATETASIDTGATGARTSGATSTPKEIETS